MNLLESTPIEPADEPLLGPPLPAVPYLPPVRSGTVAATARVPQAFDAPAVDAPRFDLPAPTTLVPTSLVPTGAPMAFPLVGVQERPPVRRRKLGLAVGIAAMFVAVGAGAFAVTQRSGGDDGPTFSLEAAAQSASNATTIEYDLSIEVNGAPVAEASVQYNTEQQRQRMVASYPNLDSNLVTTIDLESGIAYLDTSGFPGMLPDVHSQWVSYDMGKASGIDFDQLVADTGANPLDVAPLFLKAIDTQDLGLVELRGEQLKHFVVTVDARQALEHQPRLRDELEAAGNLPETYVYDVWVNEASEMRQILSSEDINGETTTLNLIVTSVGEPVSIELPPADDVQDITSMILEND